jgi:hypothetical protein
MRAINESSSEFKWRASEGGLQSVQHADSLFFGGVDIGADGEGFGFLLQNRVCSAHLYKVPFIAGTKSGVFRIFPLSSDIQDTGSICGDFQALPGRHQLRRRSGGLPLQRTAERLKCGWRKVEAS